MFIPIIIIWESVLLKITKKELSAQSIIYGIIPSDKNNIHVSVVNKLNIHPFYHKI
jgi:hypothetical protein